MNILLTGSSGNIGRILKTYLMDNGHHVYGVGRSCNSPDIKFDFNSDESLTNEINSLGINIIIHLAASLSPKSIDDCLLNSYGVYKLLSDNKNIKYIVMGSAAEYGLVNNTEFITEETQPNPVSVYGKTKYLQTVLCNELINKYEYKIVVLRLFNVISDNLPESSFIGSLFNKVVSTNKKIIVNSGKVTRDFIDVRDVSILLERIINAEEWHSDVYNLATGINTSYSDFINLANEILVSNGNKMIQLEETGKSEPFSSARADVSKLSRVYLWKPKYSIKESIKYYIDKLIEKN